MSECEIPFAVVQPNVQIHRTRWGYRFDECDIWKTISVEVARSAATAANEACKCDVSLKSAVAVAQQDGVEGGDVFLAVGVEVCDDDGRRQSSRRIVGLSRQRERAVTFADENFQGRIR